MAAHTSIAKHCRFTPTFLPMVVGKKRENCRQPQSTFLICVHSPDTVTLNPQVAVFPDGSAKLYVTKVVPTGNDDPGVWLFTNLLESSDAVGSSHVTMVTVACPVATVTEISAGQLLITGGVVSTAGRLLSGF